LGEQVFDNDTRASPAPRLFPRSVFVSRDGRVSEQVRESVESLRRFVAGFDPAALDGAQARELAEQLAELERLAGAGRTLAAKRVAETAAWAGGGFRDAGAWLASVAGTTVGKARATIETAERLERLPATESALRAGRLSDAQAEVVARAASADPSAERQLLACASRSGVKGLKTEAARVEAAVSTNQDERYATVRARRFVRHRALSDVEGLLEMRGPLDKTAAVAAALVPYEREQFEQARGREVRELPEALAFDALVQLANDAAGGRFADAPSRAPATIVVRVDKTAFDRGRSEPGEVCEIPGVGPVPVSVARKLAEDAILKALITDGIDVRSISHLGRTIPARLRTAIEELYPTCAVDGCEVDRWLETDHKVPVAEGGATEMTNLQRLCPHHHDEKHAGGSRPPDRPPDPPPDRPPKRARE
jgi:hypothetical protein